MGKVVVIGLDGMPYTLMKTMMNNGVMPILQKRLRGHSLKPINSVVPVISSVAWTSFSTGVHPGTHGILGFIDRTANPFALKIPLSCDRKQKTLWQKLSEQGQRVAVINVPISYPVEEVNGVLISCFLCTDIKKSTYPISLSQMLIEKEYIIDVDAWLVRNSKEEFLTQLFNALEKRFEVADSIFGQETWDFFQLHVMETDRLMHFFWNDMEDQDSQYYEKVMQFFQRLDILLNRFLNQLDQNTSVVILSDHGFCGLKYEVQLNQWLKEEGYLKLEGTGDLSAYQKESVCYSLLPGRIFLNMEGREEKGTVSWSQYHRLRQEIKQALLLMTCPYTGEKVIDRVHFREDIYNGDNVEMAADLIAHPNNGYDLKGFDESTEIFTHSHLTGMHTYENAMLCGINFPTEGINDITQISERILKTIL